MMRDVRSNHAAAAPESCGGMGSCRPTIAPNATAPSLVGRDDPIAPSAAAPWPKMRLGEIAIMKRGKYITRGSTRSGNIPVILGGQEPAYYCDEANHNGPCIVISRSGASAGFVSFWNEPIFVTDGFLFETTAACDIRYLYSCLKFNQHLLGHLQNGTGIPHVRGDDLKQFPVPLPPLPIQQRIASVLGAYDDLIENNRRRIALLEKMARELYRERFVRRGVKGNTVTLGKIMSITRGLSYSSKEIDTEDGVNLINLKNIRSFGGFREEGTKKYSGDYKNAQVVKKGDLVMGVTDMTQDRRTVGAVALLPDLEGESVISADLIKIDSELGNCFLFCMFCYGGVSSQVGQFATGATVLHLRPQAVLDFSVTLPAREEVEAFESQISPLFEEQGNLLSQNRSLSLQRDRLLPRLMSGKIDVEALVKEEEQHG